MYKTRVTGWRSARVATLLAAAAMAVTFAVIEAQKPASPLKVFCFAAPNSSGFVDRSSQGREDSVKDLKEAIGKKKDWLELVDAPSRADITVEVLERRIVPTGRVNTNSTGSVDKKGTTVTTNTTTREISNYTLRTMMRVGSYENEVVGEVSSEYLGPSWRGAAGQVAGEIEKWAKANYARLRDPATAAAKGAAAQAGRAAPPSPATPPASASPRQTVVDWYLAPTVAASEAYLLKTTIAQVQAFRATATGDQAMMVGLVELAIAPGPSFARMGRSVTTKGRPPSAIVVQGPYDLEITFQKEAVEGDRAFLPVTVKYADNPVRPGTFELTREAGAWRIASVDLGDDMRYPRFDGPNFVTAYSALIVKVLEEQQTRTRAGQVTVHLRTLIAAQQTYAKFNAGLFAPLECLEQPRACAPATPAEPFLASPIAVKGYTGAFHAGPPASAADLRRAPGVRRAVKAWAYVMTPQSSGSEERTYCADSSARLCMLPPGSPARIVGGQCPAVCEDVKR